MADCSRKSKKMCKMTQEVGRVRIFLHFYDKQILAEEATPQLCFLQKALIETQIRYPDRVSSVLPIKCKGQYLISGRPVIAH
jgi:hypothetical protein